jgi:hypothetical protein
MGVGVDEVGVGDRRELELSIADASIVGRRD